MMSGLDKEYNKILNFLGKKPRRMNANNLENKIKNHCNITIVETRIIIHDLVKSGKISDITEYDPRGIIYGRFTWAGF